MVRITPLSILLNPIWWKEMLDCDNGEISTRE